MIRDVDLKGYLPQYMKEYKEPAAILDAENPEFTIAWTGTNRILYNHFISTADTYGISRYEKMLGIHPTSSDTLESRRSRVQSKWFNQMQYTWKTLLQKLTMLCADTPFTLTNNFTTGYTLTLITDLELYGQVEELENILNQMIPCNIVISSNNNIPCISVGDALAAGGIVYSDEFVITNDYSEIIQSDCDALVGGGAVHTDMQIITNDFLEVMQSNGNTLVAAGVINVDFMQMA